MKSGGMKKNNKMTDWNLIISAIMLNVHDLKTPVSG